MRKSISVRRRRAVYLGDTSHIILQYVHNIIRWYIYYYYYYYILPTASARFSRAADAVVSILYFVLSSCHDCLRTHDVAYVYIDAKYSTRVPHGYDILLLLLLSYDTHTSSVSPKLPLRPDSGIKESCISSCMYARKRQNALREEINLEKEKECGHQ